MAALTTDRPVMHIGVEPYGFRALTPSTGSFYFGQLVLQSTDSTTHPYATGSLAATGVIAGICQHGAVTVSATSPLPEGLLSIRYGTFDFANSTVSPIVSGTLMNTLVFAEDDHTVCLTNISSSMSPAGRLRGFISGSSYPCLVEVGLIASGSTV